MRQSFLKGQVTLYAGDCLDVLDTLPENSIDAVVTDPPYHFASIVKRFGKDDAAPAQYGTDGAFARASRGFMGKEWDGGDIAFRPETWAKVMRVLKPGGHMVAFGAPKNYHRLACAIEDAGFEIRDSLMWFFGTGFPKSHDISKAIDKAAGAEREVVGSYAGATNVSNAGSGLRHDSYGIEGDKKSDTTVYITAPATDSAREWQGWGTALKPAYEPIVLARKPLSEKTVAANVLRWGTGALNIDACRIGINDGDDIYAKNPHTVGTIGANGIYGTGRATEYKVPTGRWPANLCHDGSQGVLDLFPQSKSTGGSGIASQKTALAGNVYGKYSGAKLGSNAGDLGDEGSAARFFYSAKASKKDRAGSKHPTVKPVSLMQWLVRLITPPNGTVLDPFAGSGTTGQAAIDEGFNVTLIEREEEYRADIKRRFECSDIPLCPSQSDS